VIGGGPGADHVNRRLATGRVEAAAERLAVDGNHLPAGHLVQGRDPTQQTLLKFRRLDGRQNRIKAVVRRNALLEIEKACEPLALLPAEMRDGHEIIGPTDHRAYRNHHDVDQRIGHAATAWIGKRGEVILNRDRLLLRHAIGSWTAATPTPLPLLEQATESQLPNHTKLPSMAQLPCPAVPVKKAEGHLDAHRVKVLVPPPPLTPLAPKVRPESRLEITLLNVDSRYEITG